MIVIRITNLRTSGPWAHHAVPDAYVSGGRTGVVFGAREAYKFATMGDAVSWLADPESTGPYVDRGMQLAAEAVDIIYPRAVMQANERTP